MLYWTSKTDAANPGIKRSGDSAALAAAVEESKQAPPTTRTASSRSFISPLGITTRTVASQKQSVTFVAFAKDRESER